MGGARQVRLPHPDGEVDLAAGHGREAVAVGRKIARDHREKITRLGKRVLPHGPVSAALSFATFDQIAVGEQDREPCFVRAHPDLVARQDIGPVGMESDPPKTLAFALRAKDSTRGVKPH